MTEVINGPVEPGPAVLIPLDSEQAGEALARLFRNLPPDVHIGRPLAAAYDEYHQAVQFITTTGIYWSHPAHAERLMPIGETDMHELTSWYSGIETLRVARRAAD